MLEDRTQCGGVGVIQTVLLLTTRRRIWRGGQGDGVHGIVVPVDGSREVGVLMKVSELPALRSSLNGDALVARRCGEENNGINDAL